MIRFLKDSKILIATFSPWKNGKRLPINGNVEPMLDFFVPKTKKTILIDQVYPGSDFVIPRIEVYEKGKFVKFKNVPWWMHLLSPFLNMANTDGTHISFKIRDFLSVLDIGFFEKEGFGFVIGFEAINALAGIILRNFGRTKYVIYYVSDYSPKRYMQRWFNILYLWLDRMAAMHADYIWDVSWAMQPARIQAGLNIKKSAPELQVPNALYPGQIHQLPLSKIIPYSLVFMGTLGEENGPDLAIKSLPLVLKKFSQVKLHMIGGGEENLKRLSHLTKQLGLENAVIFHGFISDRNLVSKTICKYAIALAPYIAIPGSARFYGDATKIRAYLAAGLPTITTHVPPLGKDASNAGAAIVVKDTKEEIAKAIILLLSNRKLFTLIRKKAIAFAKNNTWENEFMKALKGMKLKKVK